MPAGDGAYGSAKDGSQSPINLSSTLPANSQHSLKGPITLCYVSCSSGHLYEGDVDTFMVKVSHPLGALSQEISTPGLK